MNMKEKIDALIQNDLEKGCFVGANAAVFQNGRCLYSGSFGLADREKNIPMQPDTIFRIYSMTKPVTSAAVMQLAERGLIRTDQPVSDFFPTFANPQVYEADGTLRPAAREITIQHLLNMQSGLTYPGPNSPTQKDTASFFGKLDYLRMHGDALTTKQFCEEIGKIPLMFDPGTDWEYGVSADILGGIVETVTGMPYREYLKENIFLPLGMHDTDFYVPVEKQHRFAAAYEPIDGKLVRDETTHLGLNDYLTLPAFISGGAGLCSTIADYCRFAEALAGGGITSDGVRILSSASIETMRTPHVSAEMLIPKYWDSLQGYAYGNLVRVLVDPDAFHTIATPGEFGWDGWTGTYFCADPKENLTIFFWIQVACAGTSPTARNMRNLVYESLK